MKAIIRGSAGLLGLLLLASISHGWYYASAVFKTPLPTAPDCFNPGYYMQGPCGMWYGPNYYLMPPGQPFNGMLPGPTGQAIMSGFLPHTQLLSKDGLAIGKVPLLGQKSSAGEPQSPYPNPGAGLPAVGNSATPMQTPYGMPMNSPYAGLPPRPPYSGMPWTGPIPNGVMLPPLPNGGMPQMPYGAVPYGGQMPYGAPQMPYGAMPQMPYPLPYPPPAPQPTNPFRPVAYVPYRGPMGVTYVPAWQDPATGIWRVQNTAPPFGPIPGFNPQAPTMPTVPTMPNAPTMPGMSTGPAFPNGAYGPEGFQFFGPMQQFGQFNGMQGPQMPQQPRMDMAPLQGPRMEMQGPPPEKRINAFPTHPFVRSPRDFFMWGDVMEEERERRSRPNPVP